jgi:hypothetical protein
MTTTVEFILGADIRSWTRFTVVDATDEEADILGSLNTEAAVALAKTLDEADRLVWEDMDYDDNPDLFADYASPDVIECKVTPVWYRPSHTLGKWHLITDIADGTEVSVYTAACGAGIGDNGSVPTRVGIPTDPICKKCAAAHERRTA